MSFWQRLKAIAGTPNRDINDDRYWHSPSGPLVINTSVNVTSETVQQLPEVYACLKVLSETIGSLPLIMYQRRPDGSKSRVDDHPIADLLQHEPNPDQDACEFRTQMTWDLALHRNAFAEIFPGPRGAVDRMYRLDPANVDVIKGQKSGNRQNYLYEVLEDHGTRRRILPENMFHLRGSPTTSDNLMGRSLLTDGYRVFARALALEDYSRRFFDNDATPGGIVRLQKSFQNTEQAHEYRSRWQGQFTGPNRHKIAVLDSGGEYQAINVPNDKAQFIETTKEVSLQILRLFRMPPHKVMNLDRATFSNIEEQSLSFVIDTLLPLLVGWEKAIKRQLILRREYFAEYNVAGLLRGDLKTRYEAYAMARNWGWLSVNDIRKLENMDPITDGDTYLQPLNMTPIGQMMSSQEVAAQLTPKIVQALEYKKRGQAL
ncbi:MAG: phage portal protein [Pseudomonadota bacterium]